MVQEPSTLFVLKMDWEEDWQHGVGLAPAVIRFPVRASFGPAIQHQRFPCAYTCELDGDYGYWLAHDVMFRETLAHGQWTDMELIEINSQIETEAAGTHTGEMETEGFTQTEPNTQTDCGMVTNPDAQSAHAAESFEHSHGDVDTGAYENAAIDTLMNRPCCRQGTVEQERAQQQAAAVADHTKIRHVYIYIYIYI